MLRKLTVTEVTDTPDLLDRIARYIEENPDADLSLPTLAKQCFYNPSYFSRAFKKSFGTSLSDYIRDRKIAAVLALFDEGSLSAEEIAERSGFSSASAFYRTYAKARGESFSSYRGKKKRRTPLDNGKYRQRKIKNGLDKKRPLVYNKNRGAPATVAFPFDKR